MTLTKMLIGIIEKIFVHFVNDDFLYEKQNEINKFMKKNDYDGLRTIDIYENDKLFCKIDYRKTNQEKYIFGDTSLYLGKFPKEILINKLLRSKLPQNIVHIHDYFFNSNKQIIIMEKIPMTFTSFIIEKIHGYEKNLVNDIFKQIFLLIAVLQYNFEFIHNDLWADNILIKDNIDDIDNIYNIAGFDYIVKSRYTPVLIDMSRSGIHKINSDVFTIYDTETMDNQKLYKKPKNMLSQWAILDYNLYVDNFDIYFLFMSFKKLNKFDDDIIRKIMSLPINKLYMEINKKSYLFDDDNYIGYPYNVSPLTFANVLKDTIV